MGKAFLQKDRSRRLGYIHSKDNKDRIKLVKDHPWFQDFDWCALRGKKLTAPHVPTIKDKKILAAYKDESKIKESPSCAPIVLIALMINQSKTKKMLFLKC